MSDPRFFTSNGYLKSAVHEGATAFRKNQCLAKCPYPENGILRKSWRYGWNYPESAFYA